MSSEFELESFIKDLNLSAGSLITIIPGYSVFEHSFDSRYIHNFNIINMISNKFKLEPFNGNHMCYNYLDRCLVINHNKQLIYTRHVKQTNIINKNWLIKFIMDTPIKQAEFEPLFDYHCTTKAKRVSWFFENLKTTLNLDITDLYMTFELEIEIFEKQIMQPSRIIGLNTLLTELNELFSKVELNSLQ
jgi:hypothetical protein